MSTKDKANSKNGAGKRDWGITWINYDLTSADKEWLSSAELDVELPASLVDDLVMEGYKFSISSDARNNCFVASLTDKFTGGAFENHCLTGRGATPAAARVSLLYRHVVLAQGDWAFFNQPARSKDELFI